MKKVKPQKQIYIVQLDKEDVEQIEVVKISKWDESKYEQLELNYQQFCTLALLMGRTKDMDSVSLNKMRGLYKVKQTV